jgi:hypothetical protein
MHDIAEGSERMSRAPPNFRQGDVSRAIAAAKSHGLPIARIEIDPKTAKITVVIGEAATDQQPAASPWDSVKLTKARPYKRKSEQ